MSPPVVSPAGVAASRRMGGEVRALLTPATVRATAGFLGTLTLAPGEFMAAHRHPYSEEFLYVAAGDIVVRIDGEAVRARRGEAVFVARDAEHRIENVGDAEALVVFGIGPLAPSPELGHVDAEPVPFPDQAPPAVGGRR
ncbi:cupin domain-containing protein [Spirillospora sp. CA-294931]|uniref:cupin domain-containing protein n=1 Tax=Spirillospora sp. CA-294931 TaxID=3240042 RepID=UPI003D90F8AB